MNKIPCCVIQDILPLYIDEVVSGETHGLVAAHLAQCPQCCERYDSMAGQVAIPVERDIKPLKHFKKAWTKEKILIATISVLLAFILTFTGMMVYQNVEVVHDFFTPFTYVFVRSTALPGQWQRLEVGETGYLNFDSLFYTKEIVLDANCTEAVTFRIYDQKENIVVDALTLQPGTAASLEALERNTNYIVKAKTSGTDIIVRFF